MKTIKCDCCDGRGGFGRSSCGVTLSYTQCGECLGEGVIDIPENEQEELELALQDLLFDGYVDIPDRIDDESGFVAWMRA